MLADAGGGQAQWEMYVHHRISGDFCLFAPRYRKVARFFLEIMDF